jgi:hypothetical protein
MNRSKQRGESRLDRQKGQGRSIATVQLLAQPTSRSRSMEIVAPLYPCSSIDATGGVRA